NRPYLDILKVQRQLFTREWKFLLTTLLNIFFRERLNTQRELVICLIRQVIEITFRLHHHYRVASLSEDINTANRCSEVCNVQAALKLLWQYDAVELQADSTAFLGHIHTHVGGR